MSPPEGTPSLLIASFYYVGDLTPSGHCERVTISRTSSSLNSMGFPFMLLARCAAATTASISSVCLIESVACQPGDRERGGELIQPGDGVFGVASGRPVSNVAISVTRGSAGCSGARSRSARS